MTRADAARGPDLRGEPPLTLTVRGRRVLLVLAVAALLLVVVTVKAVVSDASPSTTGAASPPASAPSRAAVPTKSVSPSPTKPKPTTKPTPSPSVSSTTSTGILRSGLVGSGSFTASTWTKAAGTKTSNPHRFIVKVEGGTRIDPNDAAQQIHAILNDPRGWTGYKGASFAAVADPAKADLVIHIASPPTTTRMCLPLKVGGKWSCAAGRNVVLNSDRWQLMTPTYTDLTDYRAYMVNHEVGHFLGRGHVGCPRAGAAAPVMLQQSISLGGCRPNAWPSTPSTTS